MNFFNNKPKVDIALKDGTPLPEFKTEGSIGLDVHAMNLVAVYAGEKQVKGRVFEKLKSNFKEKGFICLRGHERALFGTGVHIQAENCYPSVKPRSGISLKRGVITVTGTVDIDYTGEVGVIIINSNNKIAKVFKEERLAQLVFSPVIKPEIRKVKKLKEKTTRGNKGFGSTGTK